MEMDCSWIERVVCQKRAQTRSSRTSAVRQPHAHTQHRLSARNLYVRDDSVHAYTQWLSEQHFGEHTHSSQQHCTE
jgi:hypothetical protein